MANWITLMRTILAFVAVTLLFWPDPITFWTALGLTVVVIWMDGLDGYVARARGETSPMGAQLDILADRIVEQVYWLAFLGLGWIPLWIPLAVMARGVLVDGFRAMAQAQGYTAFGETTMMRSKLGVLLVSSRFSRWTYAAAKAVAFCLMIAAHAPNASEALTPVAWIATVVTVFFCIVRGAPVLVEGRRFFGPTS